MARWDRDDTIAVAAMASFVIFTVGAVWLVYYC